MIYFVTGITGTLVPVIIEALFNKDSDSFFYFALRKDVRGNSIYSRFESVVQSMDMDHSDKQKLLDKSKLVEIDIEKERLGIAPDLYQELAANTEKILHGAADVRFDQPYEKIKIPNVVFTQKIYSLFDEIKRFRKANGQSNPSLYYISSGYVYGVYKGTIPEDFPGFHPGKPDNTYVRTKAEAKAFLLDKINQLNDQIVIFEPTIVGGSAKTGKTRTYNLHYIVIMLGYLGKLPFLTAPDNRLDIVPVDWVAGVVSDIMARDEYHQGLLRLASGPEAVTIGYLYRNAYKYYVSHDPVQGHIIPEIRFVPRWLFFMMINFQKVFYRTMHFCTRNKRFRKLVKGVSLLEGYFPYITGDKVFENFKSKKTIEKYTDFSSAPTIQDIRNADGSLVQAGYLDKILADTLTTGWGGIVDYSRLRKKVAVYKNFQEEHEYYASKK